MTVAPATEAVVWDAPPIAEYPVRYDVPAAGRQSRWKVALRLPLALPHLVALHICFYLAELITIVAWLIGVFSGRYDPGLAALPTGCVRWYARVITYVGLLRDEYPRFTGGDYPMSFDAPLQTQQSRAGIFFRALLVLPHVVVLYALSTVWIASVALAWFALLVSGRYPEGLRRLVIGLNRWMLRVLAYTLLLRGDYPPFSLGLHEETSGQSFASVLAGDVAAWSAPSPVYPPPAQPSADGATPPTEPALPPPTEPVLPPQSGATASTPTIFWPTARREPPTPTTAGEAAELPGAPVEGNEQSVSSEPPTHPAEPPVQSQPSFFRPRREPPQS